MRESHAVGDKVLVYDTDRNRARAESGELGIPGRPATVLEDVTPHGSRWDPFGDPARRGGAYVDSGPEGPAVYRVADVDGTSARVDVHRLAAPAEVAEAIERRAEQSEGAAQAHYAEVARHEAEADRLRQAAAHIRAIQ